MKHDVTLLYWAIGGLVLAVVIIVWAWALGVW
jgi:hypothetical protein